MKHEVVNCDDCVSMNFEPFDIIKEEDVDKVGVEYNINSLDDVSEN